MKKKLLVLIIFPIFLFGQTGVDRIENNSISLNILGTSSIVGVTYEHFFKKNISIELGIGLVGIGIGINYYISGVRTESWCPYVGIKHSTLILVDMGGGRVTYFPIGVTFFTGSKLKINIGADIGPSYSKWTYSDFGDLESDIENWISFHGNLKIGFRF